jgi:hypothetical protein
LRLAVVQGMFDAHWRYAEPFAVPGDAQVRANGRKIGRPDKNLVIDPAVLAAYAGKFQVVNGPQAEFRVVEKTLWVKVGNEDLEMNPVTENRFYLPRFNISLEFLRDAQGKVDEVWGYDGQEPFTGKRVP